MEPLGVRLVFEPERTLLFCGFLAGGVALGTISGLTPGIHANTFALLLAGVAPYRDYVSDFIAHVRQQTWVDAVPRF